MDYKAKREKFLLCYDRCIENGEIKACGRNACIELITIAEEIKHSSSLVPLETYFGSLDTGYLNLENIKKLHSLLDF